MDRDIDRRNRLSLDRLRQVSEALPDDELIGVIDRPWTAAALFAHVAFWDRFTHVRWLHAVRSGNDMPVSVDDDAMDLVNDAALPEWTVIPPATAVRDCLAAANTVDGFIAALDDAVVSRVVADGRPRLVDRSLHRREHLRTIETAFHDRLPPDAHLDR
jgi:hypothetical protein